MRETRHIDRTRRPGSDKKVRLSRQKFPCDKQRKFSVGILDMLVGVLGILGAVLVILIGELDILVGVLGFWLA